MGGYENLFQRDFQRKMNHPPAELRGIKIEKTMLVILRLDRRIQKKGTGLPDQVGQ